MLHCCLYGLFCGRWAGLIELKQEVMLAQCWPSVYNLAQNLTAKCKHCLDGIAAELDQIRGIYERYKRPVSGTLERTIALTEVESFGLCQNDDSSGDALQASGNTKNEIDANFPGRAGERRQRKPKKSGRRGTTDGQTDDGGTSQVFPSSARPFFIPNKPNLVYHIA